MAIAIQGEADFYFNSFNRLTANDTLPKYFSNCQAVKSYLGEAKG